MWFKSSRRIATNVLLTPQDYVLQLEQCEHKEYYSMEIREIIEQVKIMEKRANDLHLISFREFAIDDALLTVNQIVDGMKKKVYKNVTKILSFLHNEKMEEEIRLIGMRKKICKNDMVLADLNSLFTYVLKVQQEEGKNSLSEIDDVIGMMEDIYINELTKE